MILAALWPYARIHAKSSSFLAAQVTLADNPAIFLANTFPILPKPKIKISLPCIILLVLEIAISMAPSAVEIVFNTANSSLFIRSIISTYSSLAKSYISGNMLPAIKIFALIICINSRMEIVLSLNGELISLPLLENGMGPITTSVFWMACFNFSQNTILVTFFNSSAFSNPYVYMVFPSSANIFANFIILKSPPMIAKFVLIKFLLIYG